MMMVVCVCGEKKRDERWVGGERRGEEKRLEGEGGAAGSVYVCGWTSELWMVRK